LCEQAANDSATFLKNPTTVDLAGRGLFFMDPPQHELTRQALNPMFAKAIQGINNSAQTKAEQTLNTLDQTKTSFDLVTQFVTPITRDVFMQMFGVPQEMSQTLGSWIETMLACFNPMLSNDQRAPTYAAAGKVLGYFGAMAGGCPAHKPNPQEGLFCDMLTLVGTPALSPQECVQTAMNFALGGYLSSAFLVGTAVFNLLTRPDVLAHYLAGDAAMRLQAFEELKRFDAPFQMADRYASTQINFGGLDIPENSLITMVYGSGNRDQTVFGVDADSLNIHRSKGLDKNLVFGSGEHYCIGAPLANQVVPIVVDALLARFPKLALMPNAAMYMTDPYFRAFSQLMLTPR
jgi:cytochrome P450